MRVAFDSRSLSSSVLRGWDRYTVGLVKELVEQGIRVTLFHCSDTPLHDTHVADLDCEIECVGERSSLYWEQVAVPRALRRGRFDVFHAPAEHGVPLWSPCPVVLTIHSVTLQSYESLIERGLLKGQLQDYLGSGVVTGKWSWPAIYLRAQIARATHILTPSEFCRHEVLEFLQMSPERVTTTQLAVHNQFKRPPSPSADRALTLSRFGIRKPYLLNVGGYEPHKNVGGVLETFALVRREQPNLSLVVIGSKSVPDVIRERANSLGLVIGRDLIFLVNVTDALTDIYDEAELFLSLSWRETFCLPVLEAMTRGVPVVASAWGATAEVVGDAGRMVDPRDHQGASRAVMDILLSDRMLESQKARLRAAMFDWRNTAVQTRVVYERLLAG